MGIISHNAIVVTDWKEDRIREAHRHATNLGMCVSEIKESPVNGYFNFCVFPDGSKEGWAASEEGNEQRQALIDHLDSGQWVEVQYGELGTSIIRSSEE